MIKKIYVNTKSATDRNGLLALLFQHGFIWHKGMSDHSTDPERVEKEYSQGSYPTIGIAPDGRVSGTIYKLSAYDWPEDAASVLDDVMNPNVTVEDVAGYSAVLGREGLQIGCQLVSWEKFDELVKGSKQVRK
jgi:hypothetical protein